MFRIQNNISFKKYFAHFLKHSIVSNMHVASKKIWKSYKWNNNNKKKTE